MRIPLLRLPAHRQQSRRQYRCHITVTPSKLFSGLGLGYCHLLRVSSEVRAQQGTMATPSHKESDQLHGSRVSEKQPETIMDHAGADLQTSSLEAMGLCKGQSPTHVDGHAQAADGEQDGAERAKEVQLSQAGDVRELGDDELDGAKYGDPALQRDAAGLQQRAICACALWVVQPVDALRMCMVIRHLWSGNRSCK